MKISINLAELSRLLNDTRSVIVIDVRSEVKTTVLKHIFSKAAHLAGLKMKNNLKKK